MRNIARATVVRDVTISRAAWYEPYEGLNSSFRSVIKAAAMELDAHPAALLRQETGDPKPKMVVSGGRSHKTVTLTFQTREQVGE